MNLRTVAIVAGYCRVNSIKARCETQRAGGLQVEKRGGNLQLQSQSSKLSSCRRGRTLCIVQHSILRVGVGRWVGQSMGCYKKKRKKRKKKGEIKRRKQNPVSDIQVKGIPFAPSFFTVVIVDGRVLGWGVDQTLKLE